MKYKWLSIGVIIVVAFLFMVKARTASGSSYSKAKGLTGIRNIGHHILLRHGDSVSRVLPVDEQKDGSVKLLFEKSFAPVPDRVVDVFLKHFPPGAEYLVELRESGSDKILYSFVLSNDSTHTLIPCLQRPLPTARYELLIRMPQTSAGNAAYMAGFGFLLLGTGAGCLIYWRKKRSVSTLIVNEKTFLPIGKFRFYTDEQKLEIDGNHTVLTGKETQVLAILARSPNEIIERARIQKEVWDDDGVLLTRSLDMFISKLRKKLQADPAVSIVNVHGKGYRLDIA